MATDSSSGLGNDDPAPAGLLTFGPFRFDPTSGFLYRGDEETLLPPRVAAVLEMLARRPGEVILKDELLGEVWKDAFVAEDSLTQAVSVIRHALGDDPRRPSWIQTVPKRGYRFIGEVAQPSPATETAPAVPVSAEVSAPEPGQTLGHYELLGELGSGAMGVVFRARDRVLEREVAIKLLPASVLSDPEQLGRLEREAKLLASVSHPNIASIHSLEDEGGLKFPVLELVEGETLAERLERGPIPVNEALEIARQIASALEAAHERGVIHRDLKPANIKLTPGGHAKVLDFGFARALEVQVFEGTAEESPTESMTIRGGGRGSIVGTAAYMSPEQARGQDVDRRSDIWSFGCVLYEMLTGQRAFGGETISGTIARVLEREPDWQTLPEGQPRAVMRVLRRCLNKDPRKRLHAIADARIEIEEAIAGPTDDEAAQSGAPRALAAGATGRAPGAGSVADDLRRTLPWGLTGLALGAIVAALAFWNLIPSTSAPVIYSSINVEPGQRLSNGMWELSGGRPNRTAMALSADGSFLVYSATADDYFGLRPGEHQRLYLRRLDQPQATPILDTDGGCCPFLSPDGRWVGFFSRVGEGWDLKRAALTGGEARTVATGIGGGPFGASWGESDIIVFAAGYSSGLFQVSAAGGTPRALTQVDPSTGVRSHRLPHFLPGGQAVLFTAKNHRWRLDDAEVVALSLETGERTSLLVNGVDARYSPAGHLVFAREGTLMRVRFDRDRMEILGEPTSILDDVMEAFGGNENTATGAAQFSLSATGSLAYLPGGTRPEPNRPLVWVDRQGDYELIATPPGQNQVPRVSPDGRSIAYAKGRWGLKEVWVSSTLRGAPPCP